MELSWKFDCQTICWQTLSELYRIAPLGHKPPTKLKTVFNNSFYVCFVYDKGELVAAGRVLADGVDCAYICDVAVHPNVQGRGVGKKVIEYLVGAAQGHTKVILYANPGKEIFYRKLGFKPMQTAMAIFADQHQAFELGLVTE